MTMPCDNKNPLGSQKFASDGKIIQCAPGLRHQWKVKGSEVDRMVVALWIFNGSLNGSFSF